MTDMNEVILKADRRGRLRYTPEQKQVLIDAYETSARDLPRCTASTTRRWYSGSRNAGRPIRGKNPPSTYHPLFGAFLLFLRFRATF
jgi:hypothetical protein